MRRAWTVVLASVAAAGCFVSLGEPNARSTSSAEAEAGARADAAATGSEASTGRCPPVTDPTLLGYWPFEEDDETRIVDCSGHGLDGVLAEGSFRRVSGHAGRGIDLDGKSGCFDLGSATSLSFTGTPFTVAAWILVRTFNLSNGTSPRWVIGRAEFEDANYQGWGVGSHEPSSFELKLFPLGKPFVSVEGPIPKEEFVHVAAVHAAGRARIFSNGVVSARIDTAEVPSTLARAHGWLGCRNTTEEPFDGVIDEVRVYGRALEDAEIAGLAR